VNGLEAVVTLLEFQKKRDLEKFARTVTIPFRDFAEYLGVCDDLDWPYRHVFQRREFNGPLEPKEGDLAGFSPGASADALQATIKRVGQFFKERQVLYGHMLYTPDLERWHFIFFSERDLEAVGNHWKAGGSHVHLVNHLWPKHSAESVWRQFNTARKLAFDALHVRFEMSEAEVPY
jgi:hypothetical protein